jgi:hypothetical protein
MIAGRASLKSDFLNLFFIHLHLLMVISGTFVNA